jgi:hypothetical protein
VLLLILVGVLGVLSFLLWHAFDFALPRIIIGVITILEVATLLVAVPAFINEKYFWLLPFIGTQVSVAIRAGVKISSGTKGVEKIEFSKSSPNCLKFCIRGVFFNEKYESEGIF